MDSRILLTTLTSKAGLKALVRARDFELGTLSGPSQRWVEYSRTKSTTSPICPPAKPAVATASPKDEFALESKSYLRVFRGGTTLQTTPTCSTRTGDRLLESPPVF